ncbi:MAG: agmatine deiminase family protein [Phycisphaerales bacterium]|nr:agmatine deiminase family protein [Phycisphaerales bacterium]
MRRSQPARSILWVGMSCLAGVAAAQIPDRPTMDAATAQNANPERPLPRYLTPAERDWMRDNQWGGAAGTGLAPTGPVHCVAEYEPMDAIIIAWEGPTTWTTILAAMAGRITNAGDANLYVALDAPSEETTARLAMQQYNADMSRVTFVIRQTDSIWMRDYGPRYVYEGPCRAIIDHTYNRPRPFDDDFPEGFAVLKGHARYEIPLVHGGGNYHLDANDHSYATRLINNENPGLTEQEIHDLWMEYQNLDTTFFDPFPTSVDLTQHIDMWMQVISDSQVIISDWPYNSGSTQDQICDSAAALLAERGYTVFRVPARSVNGVHYTYTNVVMCNGIVLVPFYTNTQVIQHNAQAVDVWRDALPEKQIIQINCEPIVSAAGVMHCIVMHLPEPLGGATPTAYLKSLRDNETLTPGDSVAIDFISDDDERVVHYGVLLSTNGGRTFDVELLPDAPIAYRFEWTVPDVFAPHCRLKVIVRDADGNSGEDQSPADFAIAGTLMHGDMNCDTHIDNFDIDPFVVAIISRDAFEASMPGCAWIAADVNADDAVNNFDIDAFVMLLAGG